MIHLTDLWFKHCLGFCLIFPENGLKFNTQKFSKTFEMLFLKFHNNLFWPQSTLRRCSFDQFWRICLTLPGNDLNFVSQKFTKKKEKYHFRTLKTFAFDLKVASKPSYRLIPMANFEFKLKDIMSVLWSNHKEQKEKHCLYMNKSIYKILLIYLFNTDIFV